ncbi:ATP-binding protein [Enterobacter hormaechei]|uniref:ATP-binding protein n=1 Tax=Enterobacter hormaechei TaxID=158836 RepID=UPI0007919DB6|nr:ATP-binding protein [Enterobacter hormaechei]MCU3017173.1 ATP-binding protein [Enterobacter hormaechei subsp. oharae]MCU3615457.1 ATP-binding protein [Enterobacter hormaechei subsp. oharae]CZU94055.1 DNA mismatch repair enzyme (predicted ATPase) [Enterobacter hormaechei]CZV04571.1 DNA mismatch repair enzyme (predicted ATPase) [Enterobacter hormaechei]CZV25880.1 DNA mismatch repair enzyme (predicted ATPase) [Enterobacter hormaechei]
MPETPLQSSLFEEDYLLRELGQVAHVPQVALTELVANAWDAGASRVDLIIPSEAGGILTVTDNGHGMTSQQFRHRWMTLRYRREKHQGLNVEFPTARQGKPRKAYGRNGVGRHGLLCFADEYQVETWRDGILTKFVVGTESGASPFVIRSEHQSNREGSGTKLSVEVTRKLPDPDEIITVLSARFIHDPEFEIRVNGILRPFSEISGKVSELTLNLDSEHKATVIIIDSTQLNHSSIHQGIAFWVQKRLVGNPSWAIGQVINFDGRTRFARRYKVIVDTEGFEEEVKSDWTGFRTSNIVNALYKATAEHISKISEELAEEVVEEATADALTQNRNELASLGQGARLEVAEFTKVIAQSHPTVSPDFLATAVKAVIHLEKSRSGAALLQKLALLPHDDISGLDELLSEWNIKDALRVLDEIDSRISVIETIRRIADDPDTDELHTLHPLILRSRWLFGAEYESQEYCSNATLQTVARELFKNVQAQFINERKRPDIVVLPDNTTCQLTGLESFDPMDPTLTQLQHVLLIELKKGGFLLTRQEVNQADGYVQDIAASGAITGSPHICAWVVGQKIAKGVATDKKLSDNGQDYGRVRATTFGTLVDTANRRLMKFRDVLATRYGDLSTDGLLEKVFSQPEQKSIDM